LVRTDGTPLAVSAYRLVSADADGAHFAAATGDGEVEKDVTLQGAALTLAYRPKNLQGEWQVQLNLAMPSCDGPAGRYVEADGKVPGGFGAPLTLEKFSAIRLEDEVLGGAIAVSVNPPARFSAKPHMTVSQSEAGFEKIMQAVEITLTWPLGNTPNGTPQDMQVTLQAFPLSPNTP